MVKKERFLNNDVPVEKADQGASINVNKTSGVSIATKNIVEKYNHLARKRPYGKRPSMVKDNNNPKDIIDLVDIGKSKPNKNAQIAAKRISQRYRDIRNKKAKKQITMIILTLQ